MQVLDELLTRGVHWIEHEIERAIRTGTTWPEFLRALTMWLSNRRSLEALQLVSLALSAYGGRDDIDALRVCDNTHSAVAAALIADTMYAVQRRTLR